MSGAVPDAFEQLARPLLELIQRLTGLETSFITQIDWASQRQEVVLALNSSTLEIAEDTVVDWSDSMCRWTFLSGKDFSTDVRSDFPGSLGAEVLGLRTFFALPILDGESTVGTVCGASRSAVELGPSMDNLRLISQAMSFQMSSYVESVELRERVEQAEALALEDALTGLANRRAFTARYEEELARSGRHNSPIAVLAIDLDDFKGVNDTYGHLGGDTVLVQAAETLRRVARTEDVAARLGGDEFALLLSDSDALGARAVAKRVAVDFADATKALGMPCTLSVGVGASESSSRRSLMASADDALYRNKAEAPQLAGQILSGRRGQAADISRTSNTP